MKKRFYFPLALTFLLSYSHLLAQDPSGYQVPPKPIADLIEAALTPGISLSPDNQWMLLMERPGLPSIEEVAQPELRLAGIRINPRTNGASRTSYFTGLLLRKMDTQNFEPVAVSGLPANPRLENVTWSPDGTTVAFLNSVAEGTELWAVDVANARARRLTGPVVNDVLRPSYTWFSDSKTLIYKKIPAGRGEMPKEPSVPAGPIIQSNEGTAAPVRTFQDLLRNKHDESLFKHFTTCQLTLLDLSTNKETPFAKGIFSNISTSPDGMYVLVTEVKKPFSYIVPYSRFPQATTLYDRSGKVVRQMADLPAAENIPQGFGAVAEGPRSYNWRADNPASLYWVEAQDGGDPKRQVEVRDKLFRLDAPFTGQPLAVLDFGLRYAGVDWGNDGLAIAYERWWATRREITRRWQPGNPAATPEVLFDRSYEDSYNDPGNFATKRNKWGRYELLTADNGQSLYLTGSGASPEGDRPFVDRFDLTTKQAERLWRSETPYYESPVGIVDAGKGIVLTQREANYEPPNFFLRNLKTGSLSQITFFPNPFESLKGVKKELIRFNRADGLELTGTLYLPPGYNSERDGRLPVLMWAYPREFKSADAAGQVSGSPHSFIRTSWTSPLLWTVGGYAVFDNVAMPIIGEGDAEPNETFVGQLQANAAAAVNVVVDMGIGDRERIAVGGHSYGAFMTANLLAHTDLFAAGIARSGAYNRTLTPFGFQSEERTYWQAPDVYHAMSPFNYADRIKEPLLLIHGEADNNSGTFPMQSERMYAAMKGHGATVRLVMLPHESHGYRARESILHTAWETDQWLEKYVKKRAAKGER